MRKPVRVTLTVLGVVLGLLVLTGVAGYLIPREHVAASAITLDASPDSAWRAVRDLGTVPRWWGDMKAVERSAGATRETWTYTDRFDSPMSLEVIEDTPPRRLVLRIVPEGGPFGGTWTYDVEPAGSGARVTVTENGWISNPFFRVMARWIMGYHGTLDSYLRALGAHFGWSGEPEHLPSGCRDRAAVRPTRGGPPTAEGVPTWQKSSYGTTGRTSCRVTSC
jgi:hypothetical protein